MNRTYISPEEKVQHLSREYGKDFTINRGEAYLENGLYTALAMDLDNYSVLNKQIFLNLYQDKYTSD
ncbi:MAG: hypothetical protein LBH96_05160 [Candidatus Peribacteria bacterium]|jgi:hypothetical protein|nr:hypothetical protein [Candidatus Peribacteria bacterium]